MEAFISEIVEPRVLDLIVLILPKWRLLLYIFLMNIVIFTPVYAFGVLLISDEELMLICPSALLCGFNLVYRAVFRRYNHNNTRTALLGVCVLVLGISASGVVALYARKPTPLVLLLYGGVGGFGYQLVFSKMWKVLAKAFNAKKEMFVIHFLYSCGQAASVLLLVLVLQLPWEGYVYGSLLMLLSGIVLHLFPIVLLIEGEKNRLKLDLDSMVNLTEKGNEQFYAHVTRAANADVEVHYAASNEPQANQARSLSVSWKNPANFTYPSVQADKTAAQLNCDEHEHEEHVQLFTREGKCFNHDGVEILEMIVEEDECVLRAYNDDTGCESISLMHGPDKSDGAVSAPLTGKWSLFARQLVDATIRPLYRSFDLRHSVNRRLILSVRCTLLDIRCYSCVLLRATDTCLFVLFLAILPRFTAYHYQQRTKSRQMTILSVVVIPTSWFLCSLLLLWCDIRFRKQQDRLLIFGILFKAFGYFCGYSTKSSFWTFAGCVLIGFGQSIACTYQDSVVRRQFSLRQWQATKAGLCLLTGLAILLIAGLANLFYVYGRIDHLLLVLLLVYCAAGALWLACNCRTFFI
ncbi:uncharacterized protein LOC131213644 isoform X2 [Anopheles bellator]|uniref:uncharacterized protein LOC131213644 isoform X2 n=1 Tax=Anopheles bellator TaxID=139047 RepID=UPI002647EFA3|nr:uncharacterized protein LOC131213644 isoform X2 [Anopheles bellator]